MPHPTLPPTPRHHAAPPAPRQVPAGTGASCPRETFPNVQAARDELFTRRARAALAGSPPAHPREAYPCTSCGAAHIRRVTTAAGDAA